MTKRKQVEEFILKYIKELTKSEENVNLYKDLFKRLKDDEFHKFMEDLRDNRKHLSVIIPQHLNKNISVNDNIKLAKSLGHDFFQRITYSSEDGLPGYTTDQKVLVYQLPIRRAVQYLDKKIGIAEDNLSKDMTTGQVTGKSRARRMTFPETQVLIGYGLNKTVAELLQSRGGDIGEGNALDVMLYRTGAADLETLSRYKTGVRSSQVLAQYLNGMHIRSTL